jgi:uncharacterized protein YdeI (YjbR/CyaY-like superfamily)
LPNELAEAINRDVDAKNYFERLPPSHRHQYVEFVTEARKPETRAKRVEQTVAKLREESQKQKQR